MHYMVAVEGPTGEMEKIDKMLMERDFPVIGEDKAKFNLMVREIKLYDITFPEREEITVKRFFHQWSKGSVRNPKSSFDFKKILNWILNKLPIPFKAVESLAEPKDDLLELHKFNIPYAYNVVLCKMKDAYSIRKKELGVEMT